MSKPLVLSLLLGLSLLASVPTARAQAKTQSRCTEEDAGPSRAGRDANMIETSVAEPRSQLQELVGLALQHSRSIGALRLLSQAAEADLAETKALRLPQLSLIGRAGQIGRVVPGADTLKGMQGSATVSVSAPLYDAGRITKLTEWRTQLASAAKYGQSSAEEQLALQTVSLALDRGRYTLQAQVYSQYVRKMACLVDSLEIITKADKGRSSELIQAQKSLQQADLQYEQTLSAMRQTEIKLRRFVGDQLPVSASLSTVMAQMPDLAEMQADILQAPDVAQASAQAQAQRSYAESVLAGQRPNVNLLINGSTVAGVGRSSDWIGGVTVNIPIFQPGADASLAAAKSRYQAASLQRDDTVEAKRYRLLETYENATAALDRARRVVEILRNSDRVRASTLQQWQQLGRRSLFDVMAAEGDYYSMRVAHVNALFDAQQLVALMWSMGRGVLTPLR
ncbi:TolC family protein [Roseateles oligotrophus]|uniref:TolC family protein n=1 Tax=Roseateles oligotrophus TaxID=1769250 RepID=A0ABT2YMA1_9BURK|nr:TolC family protein [Roseateles oligotrophus]MCV2371197.1 TolC family protein [Roseateles oligotrophus]